MEIKEDQRPDFRFPQFKSIAFSITLSCDNNNNIGI